MTIVQEKKFEMTIGQELTKSPLQLSGGMSYDSKGLEEDDIESPPETYKDRHRIHETRTRRPGHVCPTGVCDTDPIFCHAAPIS